MARTRVDYHALPEVQEAKKHCEEMAKSGDKRFTQAASILSFPEGKEMWLRVKVTDPFLFREVCASMYVSDTALSVPGADLLGIDWDMGHKGAVVGWLEAQLKELNENTAVANVISLIEKLKKLAAKSKDETADDFDNELIRQLSIIAQKTLYQLTRGGAGIENHLELEVEKVEGEKG